MPLAAIAVAAVGLAACGSQQASAATLYYVSAGGNDGASGTSEANAWRTVSRVNRAKLVPGDTVVFKAGQRFAGNLTPTISGRKGKRITYSSFGTGRAKLSGGVFLRSVSHIQVDQFEISGTNQGVHGSSGGRGAKGIVITRNLIKNVSIGINAPNPRDDGWRIRNNRIVQTGDSAIIMEGRKATIRSNFISHSGRDRSISYAKHGIYAKGPAVTIIGNRILNFSTEGVSTRFRNARIVGNLIRYGQGGIAYYRNDRRHGTTYMCRNSISNVDFGIYVDRGGLRNGNAERFRIVGNRIHNPRGASINTPRGLRGVTKRGNSGALSLQLLSPSCA